MAKGATLYYSSGAPIVLGQELGVGGEGAVYGLPRRPDIVAKVYHKPASTDKAAKLVAMTRASTPTLLKSAAWPIDVLRVGSHGPVYGLLMPRILHARETHNVYSPKQRQAEFPNADWSFLVWVARNAAAAVEAVHAAGHVIGDINQKGFLVAKDATVRVIDCDSFQVTQNGRKFLCLVGVPEFTPPELHGKPFDTTERTPNHDAFGLSVLIFHLLFMGRHPFVGRYRGHGDMPLERAIRELRFAYSQTAAAKQMVPPPHTLPLSATSFTVASLFERAFGPAGLHGNRPTAGEWVHALEVLSEELVACTADSAHKYHKPLPRCPWCEIERGGGPAFFITVVSQVRSQGATAFDFQSVWLGISKLLPPAPVLTAKPAVATPAVTPRPMPPLVRNRRIAANLCFFLIGLTVLLIISGVVPGEGILVAVALGVAGKLLRNDPARQQEHAARKAAVSSAEWQLHHLVDSWERAARESVETFHAKRRELEQLATEYKELPVLAQKEKESLHRRRAELQKHAFLDRHYLRNARLPGIGTALKTTLISEGFETAADINDTVLRVAGIGQARYSVLMGWRISIEQQFWS